MKEPASAGFLLPTAKSVDWLWQPEFPFFRFYRLW